MTAWADRSSKFSTFQHNSFISLTWGRLSAHDHWQNARIWCEPGFFMWESAIMATSAQIWHLAAAVKMQIFRLYSFQTKSFCCWPLKSMSRRTVLTKMMDKQIFFHYVRVRCYTKSHSCKKHQFLTSSVKQVIEYFNGQNNEEQDVQVDGVKPKLFTE